MTYQEVLDLIDKKIENWDIDDTAKEMIKEAVQRSIELDPLNGYSDSMDGVVEFCPKCGNFIAYNSLYCDQCGQAIDHQYDVE